MIVFEVIEKGTQKKVFVANYTREDERLFPVDLAGAQLLKEDMAISIVATTNIRRHTEGCFVKKQFHMGDKVVLTPNGDWECNRSLESYAIALFRRVKAFCQEIVFEWKKTIKDKKLGSIERKVAPISDFVSFFVPNFETE